MTTGYFGHPLSPVDDPEAPLWCADFDSDLLRLIPSVLDALGDTANVRCSLSIAAQDFHALFGTAAPS